MSAVKKQRPAMGTPVGTSFKRVCFVCRLCFHSRGRQRTERPCSVCQAETIGVGTHFRAPRKLNKKAWAGIEAMARAGVHFGPHGVGPTPKNPGEAKRWTNAWALSDIAFKNDQSAKDALGMRPDQSGKTSHWDWRLKEWRR